MPRRSTTRYTDPELRERLKERIRAGTKGGRAGQWSARKSQLLVNEYEKQGGGYVGEKSESAKALEKWQSEEWQTRTGETRARQGAQTRRYLPRRAWEELTPTERARTDQKKRRASRRGQQFVPNTETARDAARRVRRTSRPEPTRKELYERARARGIPGRSRMDKAALRRALARK